LKRISTEIHAKIADVYQSNSTQQFVMTNGDPFLLGFVAACGYVRNRGSMEILDKALDRLLGEFDRTSDDPLRLDAYERALAIVNASRGKDARRLVDDTFRRFFLGVTTELDWLDTASQMTEGSSH
jgi:hypothetical protein